MTQTARPAMRLAGVGGSVGIVLAVLAAAMLEVGCGPGSKSTDKAIVSRRAPLSPITLGDVETDEPLRRVRWIQPLADYLADNLAYEGIDGGDVVVARSLDEMARLLRDGEVDLYLDSPLPTLAVARASGARIILRRWVRDQPEYQSLFLVHRDSDLAQVADLEGRTVAFQERHSTTGFLLPVHVLRERGYEIRMVSEPAAMTAPGQVGCYFSGDEENSLQLLLNKAVVAAVASSQDFEELPEQLRSQLRVVDRTASVPRQLVSVRPGLGSGLVERITELLLGLTDADRERLASQVAAGGWTWRFDELPPGLVAQLERYSATVDQFSVN